MTRLFVGNLPSSATDDSVRALFAEHGTVKSVDLIMDRQTGGSRGFGFVEMSAADASRAIQGLHLRELEGHALKVKEAHARKTAGSGRGAGRY